MSFLQRNLPILVLGFAGLLIALGTFGFVQTQRELPARDLTILADEQGSGYFQVAERHTKRTVLRQIEIELPEMSMADADVALARLNDLEANVTQRVRVSAAYLPEVLHLRSHIRGVMVDLLTHKRKLEAQPAAGDPATAAPETVQPEQWSA